VTPADREARPPSRAEVDRDGAAGRLPAPRGDAAQADADLGAAPALPQSVEEVVVLRGVSKSYGRTEAVRDLSLTLRAGEVFAFLGPNGAGKTTTMKLTVGLLRPDQGEITVCGHSMARDGRRAKEQIAYVPDLPFLYDKLTGREFIRFTCDMYGVPPREADERLKTLARRLEMGAFLDQLAESYSHGMRQKVALAAALIHQPRLLVVDEPMVGLDPRAVRVIKTIFREVALSGGTVFMSTHTLEIAEAVADRIGILLDGQLAALGTLPDLQRKLSGDRLEDIFLKLTGFDSAPP
jgi:ABC-2 type transport system ATP-binding protein